MRWSLTRTNPLTQIAISYARISSKGQQNGTGLARQIEMTKAYCEEMGFTLDTEFRDDGLSAFSGKNKMVGQLARILELIKQGYIKPGTQLIVEAIDRISREAVMTALATFTDIINAGVTIHTVRDQQVYDSQTIDKNPSLIYSLIAHINLANIESAQKRSRGAANWNFKRRNAATVKMSGRVPAWLDVVRDGKRIVEFKLNDRAEVVKDIFRMFTEGMGRGSIAAWLNEKMKTDTEKYKPFGKAKVWYGGTVQKVTENPAVIGHLTPMTTLVEEGDNRRRKPAGEVIKDYYPPAISESLWVRARQMSDERSVKPKNTGGRKGTVFNNLFSGLPCCENCGRPMRYKDRGARSFVAFRCSTDIETKGKCNPTRFQYQELEEIAITLFGAIKLTQQNAPDDLEEKIAHLKVQEAEIEAAITALRPLLRKNPGAIQPLMNAELDALNALQAERQKLENEVIAPMGDSLADAMRAFVDFRAKSATLANEDRRRARAALNHAFKTVIESMTFSNDNVCNVTLRDGQKYAIAPSSVAIEGEVMAFNNGLIARRLG
jgi:DNA invertase Pin-like site-specific DNA recombinase